MSHTFVSRPRALPAAVLALASISSAATVRAQPVMEEVEVVGTPHDQSPSEIAQPVTVLRGDTLRRVQGGNLGETLAGQLGVSSTFFGSGASRPLIRGLGGPRVKIVQDGIDSLDASVQSADHAVGVEPLVAEQIEIFRGPATLLYGSGAVGGVVNTITNRIPEAPLGEGVTGAVELGLDTAADSRTAAMKLDGGRGSLAWHLDGARRSSADYEVPGEAFLTPAHDDPVHEPDGDAHGFVPNSDLDTSAAAFGVSRTRERGFFGASLSALSLDYGVPGHEHAEESSEAAEGGTEHEPAEAGTEHDEHAQDVRVALEQRRLDLDADWLRDGSLTEIGLRLGVSDYEHVELEGHEAATVFQNDAYEARLEILHAPLRGWEGAFGVQLGERRYAAIGEEAYVPPVETASAGLFAIEQREVGAWRASLGARVERVRHEPSGGMRSAASSATSVSAAAVRSVGAAHAFVLNGAMAERAPAAEELYSNGPHLATRTFEVGDPALGVETSRHLDIALRKTQGRLTWAVTGFVTRFDDFIYLAETGAHDAASGLRVLAYRQRDAQLAGYEAEVFASVAEVGTGEIDVRVYADAVDAELDTGEGLPRVAPRRGGVRVQYHDDRFLAGIEAVVHAAQRDTAPYETPTRGYTLLGVDFDWKLRSDSLAELRVLVRGSNLLDEDARKHTSPVKDSAPLPGRNFSIGFRAAF